LLLGFAAGVPLTVLAEGPIDGWLHPAARQAAELTEQLRSVSSALDDGNLERARTLLDRNARHLSASDRRVAALRARLTLSLILASRPDDARRELLAIQDVPGIYPPALEIRRVFDATFGAKPSAASAAGVPPPSAPRPAQAKAPLVSALPSRQTLLSAARDRQRRSLLDEAQRFYEQVLVNRPSDSEARCGLAEVQLLRGSVADARELFERALRSNQNYVPAWVGLADIDWLQGRSEPAKSRYQLVVDRFPAGSYPPYIVQRIARVMGSSVSSMSGSVDRE
jgi:tetratricopeptide (TPR) repeat protein